MYHGEFSFTRLLYSWQANSTTSAARANGSSIQQTHALHLLSLLVRILCGVCLGFSHTYLDT